MTGRASIYQRIRSVFWTCFMFWSGCGRRRGVSSRRGPRSSEAHQWVEDRLRRLLEGKVDSVIRSLRYQATQHGLKGQKRKTVLETAGYYARNRDRMKYDEYLAAGYPIGSGVVEGACRHLVKDRMERSGMRWIPAAPGDARPTRYLPQRRVEPVLEVPCRARGPTALRQNRNSGMRLTQ